MSVETVASAATLVEKNKPSSKGPPFILGDKRLSVSINKMDKVAATKILTIEGAEKIPGATTELYKQALEAIRQAATMLGQPIEYTFSTREPKMKAWAKDPAKSIAIFQWKEEDFSEENGRLTAKKIIHPDNG